MSSKRDFNKNRQIIMKSKSLNEENGEKIGEEIVFIINAISHNNSLPMTLISDFSQKQVIGFIIMISVMINVRLE